MPARATFWSTGAAAGGRTTAARLASDGLDSFARLRGPATALLPPGDITEAREALAQLAAEVVREVLG